MRWGLENPPNLYILINVVHGDLYKSTNPMALRLIYKTRLIQWRWDLYNSTDPIFNIFKILIICIKYLKIII